MNKGLNILFVCTSNKDRSPALEKYFREVMPEHQYRSAGINKYFTSKKGTHYLTDENIYWADFIVYCEEIHCTITTEKFLDAKSKESMILGLGEYKQGCIGDDYLLMAELVVKNHLSLYADNFNK